MVRTILASILDRIPSRFPQGPLLPRINFSNAERTENYSCLIPTQSQFPPPRKKRIKSDHLFSQFDTMTLKKSMIAPQDFITTWISYVLDWLIFGMITLGESFPMTMSYIDTWTLEFFLPAYVPIKYLLHVLYNRYGAHPYSVSSYVPAS